MSDKKPPEPGKVEDLELGIPGEAYELPPHDADEPMETGINDDEDVEEVDE